MKGSFCRLFRLSSLGLLVFCSQVFAAGYKLETQSASVFADAGDAAVVEDAGTNWFNSAGLVDLPRQFVASSTYVYLATTFAGNMQAPSLFGPAFSFNSSGRASSHINAFLPSLHYAIPLSKQYALGLSIVPAWGLSQDYGEASFLRYDLTRIYTRTIDLAPSFAARITPAWSVGLGPDFHYLALQSKSYVRTQGPAAFGGTLGDSISRLSATSWNYGAHIGVLYRIKEGTRIGANYRAKIVQKLDGFSHFILGPRGPNFESRDFQFSIALPPTTSLSAYHEITPCLAVMGTLAYDQWSVISNYHARNLIQPTGIIPNLWIPQHMRNTLDVSAGTHYKLSDKALLRFSLKYEPTPTKTAFRDVNFPDGDKLGVNLGSRYQMTKKVAFDLLYSHVFNRRITIHGVNPLSQAIATGRSRMAIDIFGAQVVLNF